MVTVENHAPEHTRIVFFEKPKLKNPIFIEGLPGVGYVGRNVAGFIAEELKAKKFAEIYSHHFPPVVLIETKTVKSKTDEEIGSKEETTGRIIPIKNELFYCKAKKKGQRDLIILIGDAQSMDPQGHYALTEIIINVVKQLGAKEIITIGGFETGVLTKAKPRVFGATMNTERMRVFEKLGVRFKGTNIGQIIGASGLFVAIGYQKGLKGVCLMGETPGIFIPTKRKEIVDPKATEAVLGVLSKYLNTKFDLTKIEQRAKELERFIKKIEELQAKLLAPGVPTKKAPKEELGYIG